MVYTICVTLNKFSLAYMCRNSTSDKIVYYELSKVRVDFHCSLELAQEEYFAK